MYILIVLLYSFTTRRRRFSHGGRIVAHKLEIIDGKAQMAYAGEEPWHGLGTKVPPDLTPAQMCEAAGLDWEVETRTAYCDVNGERIATKAGMLVRKPNGKNITTEKILTFLPNHDKWHELQNDKAFEFFNDFVMKGDMEMHTAGSLELKSGVYVWALAKVKESFKVVGRKDEVQSYLLFTNPHQFGTSIDVRGTPTRVVCWNTISMALQARLKEAFKVSTSHRNPFDADTVKEKLLLAHNKLGEYKERAQFLASKQYTVPEMIDYFKAVFPTNKQKKRADGSEPKRAPKEFHRGAQYAMSIVDTQPGAEFAPGSWWNLFNAATFYTNHLAGKSESTRVESLWYGENAQRNIDALNLAVKGADGKLDEGIKELLAA